MRIGVFADVHGNLPALEAVLAALRACGVDLLLFAGDAFGELDRPCETVDLLRSLTDLRAARGNREEYLDAQGDDAPGWTCAQYAPLGWNHRALGADRRAWLVGLPETYTLHVGGLPPVRMAHKGAAFAPGGGTERVDGEAVIAWHDAGQNTQHMARRMLASDEGFRAEARMLPKGVYIFGHSHMQWSTSFDGRLFVNPGSCGLPLDLIPGAPYTILEDRDGAWHVEAGRAAYDVDATADALLVSGFARECDAFARITADQLRQARPSYMRFLRFAASLAHERGLPTGPVDDAIYHEAAAIWLSGRAAT